MIFIAFIDRRPLHFATILQGKIVTPVEVTMVGAGWRGFKPVRSLKILSYNVKLTDVLLMHY
jgi:hypothetical protein